MVIKIEVKKAMKNDQADRYNAGITYLRYFEICEALTDLGLWQFNF